MSDNGYTQINVSKSEEALAVEEANKLTPESTEDDENIQVKFPGDNDEEDEQEDENKPKVGRPKGSTNKKRDKRIQQLVEKAKKEEERAAQLERELENLQTKLHSSTRSSIESRRASLEKEIEAIEKELQTALDDDETGKAVQLQRKLMETSMQLASTSYELEHTPEEVPKRTKQNIPEPSQYAMEWVSDHPEFNEDIVFHQAALGVNSLLLNEGYDPDDEDFYLELDKRLSKRFPEYFGNSDVDSKNMVQSKGEQNKTGSHASRQDDGTENLEVELDDDDDGDIPQTVAGASRTPTGSAPTNKKVSRKSDDIVKLSEEDVNFIKTWNLDPKSFAKRKQLEGKKEKGEYVPIRTGK